MDGEARNEAGLTREEWFARRSKYFRRSTYGLVGGALTAVAGMVAGGVWAFSEIQQEPTSYIVYQKALTTLSSLENLESSVREINYSSMPYRTPKIEEAMRVFNIEPTPEQSRVLREAIVDVRNDIDEMKTNPEILQYKKHFDNSLNRALGKVGLCALPGTALLFSAFGQLGRIERKLGENIWNNQEEVDEENPNLD